MFGQKNVWSEKILIKKKFWSKNFFGLKKIFGQKKCLVQKNFWSEIPWSEGDVFNNTWLN